MNAIEDFMIVPLEQISSEGNIPIFQLTVRNLMGSHSIRFAASPEGSFRWQPPRPPTLNRTSILQAYSLPPRCPQAGNAGTVFAPDYFIGDEDCLFLSVYAPSNATQLPVLVYIRENLDMNFYANFYLWILPDGGGYGQGRGDTALSALIHANENGFVGVAIQYRVSGHELGHS